MKINAITPFKTNQINYFKANQPRKIKTTCPFDSVSFTSLQLRHQNDENVKEACNFGLEIYKKGVNYETVSKLIKSKVPKIELFPMEELSNNSLKGACTACFMSGRDDSFKAKNMRIYIPQKPKENSNTYKLMYLSEIAHEYTHILQAIDKEDTDFMKNLARGDLQYLYLLITVSEYIFKQLETRAKERSTVPSLDSTDKFNIKNYGIVIPREKHTTKDLLLKNAHYKNEEEFANFIFQSFVVMFGVLMKCIYNDFENVDTEVKTRIVKKFQEENGVENFFYDLMEFCSYRANHEAQAYTTSSMLAKKVQSTDSSMNIDVLPLYYEMLADALNKKL